MKKTMKKCLTLLLALAMLLAMAVPAAAATPFINWYAFTVSPLATPVKVMVLS